MSTVQTHLANAYEVETNASVGPNDLVFSVPSTAGSPPMPAWMVIEPGVSNQREYIKFSSKTASSFVVSSISDRYGDDSAASSGLTHPSGSKIRCSPLKQHHEEVWQKINEIEHERDHASRHQHGGADSISAFFVPKGGGTFTGGLTVTTGGLTISGNSVFNDNLSVNGVLTALGNMTVGGATTFTGAPSYASDPASDNVLSRKSYVDDGDAPATTHIADTAGHSATSAPTANRIARRDGGGRLQVNEPNAGLDATNKTYVDDLVGYVKVDEKDGTGSNALIDFDTIPQTFDHLLVMGRISQSGAVDLDTISGRFNGDISASNITYIRRRQQGTVVSLSDGSFTAYHFLCGTAGVLKLFIPYYRSGSTILPFTCEVAAMFGVNTNNHVQDYVTGRYEIGASNLTSISFEVAAGNWNTTAKFSLYGMT